MKKKTSLSLIIACNCFISMTCWSQQKNMLTEQEKKQGWQLLFDGRTMNGWRTYKNKPTNSWEVSNGEFHCKRNEKNESDKRADLITESQYENFELEVEWKISKAGNSGIMYHVTEEYDAPYLSGPEYQLIDDDGFPEKLADWQKTGADYAMYATTLHPIKAVGEYNTTKIVVSGNHREHWLNGVKVLEFEALTPDWNKRKAEGKWKDAVGYGMSKTGYICLQDHGSEIWFRNIKIKKL
jgi:Domain of Unknown Function (DUF1080)